MKHNKFLFILGNIFIIVFGFAITYLCFKPLERLDLRGFFLWFYLSLATFFIGIFLFAVSKKHLMNSLENRNRVIVSIIIVLIVSFCSVLFVYNAYSSYAYDWIGTEEGLDVDENIPYNKFFSEKRGYEGKYSIQKESVKGTIIVNIKNFHSPVSAYDDLDYCVEYIETDNLFFNFKFNFEKSALFSDEMRVKSKLIKQRKNDINYSLSVENDDYALKICTPKSSFYMFFVNTQITGVTVDEFVEEAIVQYLQLTNFN